MFEARLHIRDSDYSVQQLVHKNNPDNQWRDRAYSRTNFNPRGESPKLNPTWQEQEAWDAIDKISFVA